MKMTKAEAARMARMWVVLREALGLMEDMRPGGGYAEVNNGDTVWIGAVGKLIPLAALRAIVIEQTEVQVPVLHHLYPGSPDTYQQTTMHYTLDWSETI